MKLRHLLLLLVFAIFACNKNKSSETEIITNTVSPDTIQVEKPIEKTEVLKEYKNDRFRKVTVEKLGGDKFRVRGEAQVFEATFNWNVEDGHFILKEGFTTTTMGAPEWGSFDFAFEVKKAEANSSLTLILFERSAKDGSIQHELPISLE